MANITEVSLLSVPLEKDYTHTMYFPNIAEQEIYFDEQEKFSFTDFSYQRKDNVIRLPVHIDTLYDRGINYVSYLNKAYSNKRFYAFITDMKYVNDERTDVYIQTDCIQTWMFDIEIKPCFVEREHAASDNYGEHTIDEGLETGSYVVNGTKAVNFSDTLAIIAAVTKTPDMKNAVGRMYHGMYSGLAYIPFPASGDWFEKFVASYDSDAAADAIAMVFLAPQALLLNESGEADFTWGTPLPETKKPFTIVVNKVDNSHTGSIYLEAEFMEDLDGYTPKNKKLLCYPYRYLLASNNAGGSAVYKFEKFGTGLTVFQPAFTVWGSLCPGCSIRMVPMMYNGAWENHEEGLNMGKYPTLNWTSDAYTNWLTQNSVNIGLNLASGAAQVIGGGAMAIASGGLGAAVGGGQIMGGLSSIAGTLGQIYQQSLTPPQARGNTNAGDVVTATGDNEYKLYTMTIKQEYAVILDEFFNMYGYKCNRVKIPEKNHREAYWYTKTIDANITGAIPQSDLQTIKDCYNKGITFWKTRTNFRNYNVSNGTV